MNDEITKYSPESLTIPNEILENIKKLHSKISLIVTPAGKVKKRPDGFHYVELSYMKKIADENYPGWSWIGNKPEYLRQNIISGTHVIDMIVACSVTGTLVWNDCGLWRKGTMSAAHRVQMLTNKSGYSDVGNDTKSAVTDTMKKALNTFMNISDDVYKNIEETLSNDDNDILIKLCEEIGDVYLTKAKGLDLNKIKNMVKALRITPQNIKSTMRDLNVILKQKQDEEKEQEV